MAQEIRSCIPVNASYNQTSLNLSVPYFMVLLYSLEVIRIKALSLIYQLEMEDETVYSFAFLFCFDITLSQ